MNLANVSCKNMFYVFPRLKIVVRGITYYIFTDKIGISGGFKVFPGMNNNNKCTDALLISLQPIVDTEILEQF